MRAIAVILVILDHLGSRFTGGFVGVDVFFVISGYLISANILSQCATGSFSVSTFYEHRIRRIFPALVTMLFGTTVLALILMVPPELVSYTGSMLAALFSVSNIFFWHQAGYFDLSSAVKPLLHTWSLGVEEQFYVVFPLFIVLVNRLFPKRLMVCIYLVALLSFIGACVSITADSKTAFFMAPLRAWELLLGTIISQERLPPIRGEVKQSITGLLGLILIFIPALKYSSLTIFPGFSAIEPCVGAALIIMAGESGPYTIGKLLSWRPVAFIGVISYSLYLWHWPLEVFQRLSHLFVTSPMSTKQAKFSVLTASIIIATLSWKFVETPFRRGRFRPGRRAMFIIAGATTSAVLLASCSILISGGFSGRYPAAALAVANYMNYDPAIDYRGGTCFMEPDESFEDFKKNVCLGSQVGKSNVVLFGDSHAAALYPGISKVFNSKRIQQATVAQCAPILDEANAKPNCRAMSAYMFGDFLLRHNPATVILVARWHDDQLLKLAATVALLKQRGIRITIIGPSIEYDLPLPRILAIALRDKSSEEVALHRDLHPEMLDHRLAILARNSWRVNYISVYEDLCTKIHGLPSIRQTASRLKCPVFGLDDAPILFDTDHFTPQGAIAFSNAIKARNQLR